MKLKNNPFYYLFYKINSWLTNIFGTYDETNALIFVSFLCVNILSLLIGLFLILIDYPLYDGIVKDNKYYLLIPMAMHLYINHYFLIRKGRHLKIMEYYKNESKLQSRIGSIAVVLFIILSFASIFMWKPLDYDK